MEITNTFTVEAPIEKAWELLTDIPFIAPCMPGAKLTGDEDGVYSGGVKIKVGPVTAEYKGTAEFVEKDGEAQSEEEGQHHGQDGHENAGPDHLAEEAITDQVGVVAKPDELASGAGE